LKEDNREVRKYFIKPISVAYPLCCVEAWTMIVAEQKRLEAMEMRCYRRIMKIKWTERMTNEEVLRRSIEKRNILKTPRRGGRFFWAHFETQLSIKNSIGGRNIWKEL
jgi:hypothetical protein